MGKMEETGKENDMADNRPVILKTAGGGSRMLSVRCKETEVEKALLRGFRGDKKRLNPAYK